MAGVARKYAPGPFLFAGALSGSWGDYDTARDVAFPAFTDSLSGNADVMTLNARLRAAYTLQQGDLYLRPQVDLDATYVETSAFTESGGLASVATDAMDNTVFSVSPALEFGGQVALGDGLLLRPYVRAGVSLYANADFDYTGVLTADTSGAEAFAITSSTDDVLWTIAAGVDVLKGDTGALQLFYEGRFGETTTVNAAGAKLSLDF
jgi:outer membrane autotransporter protein